MYYSTNSVLFQHKVIPGCLSLLNFNQKAMPVKEHLAYEKGRFLGIRINYP